MPLSVEQRQFIIACNRKMQNHLKKSSTAEQILVSMAAEMPTIRSIMDSTSSEEMDELCEEYDGFYYYMKMLEKLAMGIANGTVVVPKF